MGNISPNLLRTNSDSTTQHPDAEAPNQEAPHQDRPRVGRDSQEMRDHPNEPAAELIDLESGLFPLITRSLSPNDLKQLILTGATLAEKTINRKQDTNNNCEITPEIREMISNDIVVFNKLDVDTREVRFSGNITDDQLGMLVRNGILSDVSSLDLSHCQNLTDAGLAHLSGLTQLTSLDLGGCWRLSNEGMGHLAVLTQLTSLNLCFCENVTDAGLGHLSGLTQLTSLNLSGCWRLSNEGMGHLAVLTQLTSLDLSWCLDLTDAGLEHLAELTQLTSLDLNECWQLTDAGLEPFRARGVIVSA